jgi:hypothetical protein
VPPVGHQARATAVAVRKRVNLGQLVMETHGDFIQRIRSVVDPDVPRAGSELFDEFLAQRIAAAAELAFARERQ